jgi:hypothetical protein
VISASNLVVPAVRRNAMSEPTIEEAWEWLDEKCGERMKLHKPAARALALATLEAACPFPPQVCARYAKQSAVHCLHQVVRAEIGKLGR